MSEEEKDLFIEYLVRLIEDIISLDAGADPFGNVREDAQEMKKKLKELLP